MKRLNNLWYLLMVIVFVFSLSGCAGESQDILESETTSAVTTQASTTQKETTKAQTTAATTTTQAVTEVVNPFAQRVEISWLTDNCLNYTEGRWDELELEEKFNIDIKVWNIDSHNTEQLTMMMAAGDFPNFARIQYWNDLFLFESKLIRTVKSSMFYKYLPSYAAYRDAEPFSWKMGLVEGTTDEYYGMLQSAPQDTFPWTYSMFRLDWLENLGYEFDDLEKVDALNQIYITNRQFSFEELNEIYKSLTIDDPDGNGEDDTFARLYINMAEWEGNLTGMFNFVPVTKYIYLDEATGDYVDFRAYTGMRDFYEWLTDVIHKGYVRTAAWADYTTLLALPNVGHLNPPAFAVRSAHPSHQIYPPNVVLKENPDIKMVITPPPQGPSGKGNMYVRQFTKWQGSNAYFGEDTTDEQLARLLMLLEYANFGDNALRYAKGIEGVHFTWEAEPYKSMMFETPVEKIPMKYRNDAPMRIFNVSSFATTMYAYLGLAYVYENYFFEEYWKANQWFEKYGMVPSKNIEWAMLPTELQTRYNDTNKVVNAEVSTVYNDFYKRVFAGQIGDMNTEWSQYINALYAAGYEKLVEIFNDQSWTLTKDLYKGSRWVK